MKKKIIRSTNDLPAGSADGRPVHLPAAEQKIITGVENGLGGMWAQASTTSICSQASCWPWPFFQLIYAIDFRGAASTKSCAFRCRGKFAITAAALVLYALLLPELTFPLTLALNIVLCADVPHARRTRAMEEAEAKKMTKKQFGVIVLYSVILTVVLWLLFTQILKCVLPDTRQKKKEISLNWTKEGKRL